MFVPAGLTHDQRLTFLIGLAERLDVSAETTAHTIFREMHRAIGAVFEVPAGYAELHDKAVAVLADSGFEPEVVAAGAVALGDALAAHETRKRLLASLRSTQDQLADTWVRKLDPLAGRQLPDASDATLAEFEACIAALERAEHQLSSFVFLIPATEFDQETIQKLVPANLAIARGEFTVDATGAAVPA